MKRPAGHTDDHMPPIVKLNKAIYGPPKSSKYFKDLLSKELLKLGFVRTISYQQ